MGNSATKSGKENTPQAHPVTEEFSTAHTSTDDVDYIFVVKAVQEEIIIRCSLEEITKSFFQDYVIVWHDPNVNSQENQQYFVQLKKFCDVFTFPEWQKARDFIQSIPAACHVVTSGTNGELLAKEISSNQNVVKIYIFCGNKEYHSNWAKKYSKVSCIETSIGDVLTQIQHNLLSWYKQASSLKLNLPAFAPIFNDSDKSQMNNLHRFLKVIPNFHDRLQAKNDFINLSKAIYSDPKKTKLIASFEQNYNEYNKEQTLKWYTQQCFLYKVTNNCLRIATSDSIQYCRLLLQDIQRAIKEQYQTKSKNFNGILYRGAYLHEKEWLSLKTNLNREIEMHGFLSTSKKKSVAMKFLSTDPSKKALITIIVPKGSNEEEQGFAEMEEFSEYPQEKEILFNVRSRFTILETEDEGLPYRHLVLLYGAQGFRKFMTEQNPILEISIPSQKDILCSQCKVTSCDKIFFISLLDPQKLISFCQKCLDHSFAPFLCIPPTNTKETFTSRISGCLLMNSQETKTQFYGYECSKCQAKKQKQYYTCTDCNEKLCQNCFEDCLKAGHPTILETFPFAFWSQEMSSNELNHLKFQNDFVTNNNHIFQQAEMYSESLLYDKAVEYYNIYIQQNEAKGQDSNLATCYQNLGVVFQKQGEYKKALEYDLKSLDIKKSIYGDNHSEVATSFHNLGLLYYNQGDYEKALEHYFKSLDINRSVFGENHSTVATSYNNIGLLYYNQGKYNKALRYYFKALDIDKSIYGENHPRIASPYNNIGRVYYNQREFIKALTCYNKSLDINKSVYGDNHPKTATSFHNIGLFYCNRGEYNQALTYYFKSLEINKSVYGENHPTVATVYNNIGMAFHRQGEYRKALEYYLKSLNIFKSVYGGNHSKTIETQKRILEIQSIN